MALGEGATIPTIPESRIIRDLRTSTCNSLPRSLSARQSNQCLPTTSPSSGIILSSLLGFIIMHLFRLASTAFVLLRKPDATKTTTLYSTTVADLTAQKYADFREWLTQSGGNVSDKIELKPSSRGGGYGAFVTEAVEEGEVLFTVPRKACFTLDDAISDEACGEAFRKVIEKAGPGGNTVVMAGYLAKEWLKAMEDLDNGRKLLDTSKFGPYLRTLPWERGVNSQEHILFWSENEVESRLKGSMCYSEAKALREEVALAIKVMNSIVSLTVREYRGEYEDDGGFKWPWQVQVESKNEMLEGLPEATKGAFVSILTRAFQDGDGDEEKLVPMLDMLQHSDEPNISHAMRKHDGTVEVRARRTLEAGEELLNQYRSERDESMPYHRFFTRFGFVPGIQEDISNLLEDNSSIFFAQKAEV